MTSHKIFHIRCMHDIENPRYIQFAKERTVTHILVSEAPDDEEKRPHIHCHFTALNKNDQSVRREFLKWFPEIKGNGDYSCKERNAYGFNYVCKGTDRDWDTGKPTVLSTTFSEDEIKEFHRLYWNHHDRIVVPLTDSPEPEVKKKREKRPTWTQEIISELKTAYPSKKWNLDLETDKISLCDKILDRMGEGGKALDEIIFRRIFYAVYNGLKHHMTDDSKTEFRQKFYRCLDK